MKEKIISQWEKNLSVLLKADKTGNYGGLKKKYPHIDVNRLEGMISGYKMLLSEIKKKSVSDDVRGINSLLDYCTQIAYLIGKDNLVGYDEIMGVDGFEDEKKLKEFGFADGADFDASMGYYNGMLDLMEEEIKSVRSHLRV